MRIRTGHGPQDWTDPDQGAYARVKGFGGRMIGEYVPASFTPQPGRKRHTGQDPETIANELVGRTDLGRPRSGTFACGHAIRVSLEPCGRIAGHGGDHRSRRSLERRARSRLVRREHGDDYVVMALDTGGVEPTEYRGPR